MDLGNDLFANAFVLPASGASATQSFSNVGYTRETGEQASSVGSSAWFVWVPTAAQIGTSVQVDTIGAGYDTFMAIYSAALTTAWATTYTVVSGSITFVTQDDDGGGSLTSKCLFTAAASTMYFFQVGGYSTNQSATSRVNYPPNAGLSGAPTTATVTGVTATVTSTAVAGTATGGSTTATVTGVTATVTSTAVAGTATGGSTTATVVGVTATVISTAVAGTATVDVAVAGVTASLTATAPVGTAVGISYSRIAGTGARSRTASAVAAVNAPPSDVVDLVFTVVAHLPAAGAGAVTVAHAAAPDGRWQLEDPVRGDVYVFPINPKTASSPEPVRKITETATTTGKPISHEGSADPVTWTLAGQLVTAAELAALTDFYHRPNKIFLTDDLARTWVAYLEAFQPIPRLGPEVHVANYTLRVVLFQELT